MISNVLKGRLTLCSRIHIVILDLFGRVTSRCLLAEIHEAMADETQVSGQSQEGLRRTKGHSVKQEMTSEEATTQNRKTRGLSAL